MSASAPTLSSPTSRWLRAANHVGTLLRWRDGGGFHMGSLLEAAMRAHSLHDFGPAPWFTALKQLLHSLEREARLNPFGYLSTRWDLVRLLGNRLLLQSAFARDPGLAEQPIRSPFVISGLPRSGSTFLHRLLAQDPANTAPRHFEALFPVATEPGPDLRRERVKRQLALLRHLAPELASLHPLTADTPQECTEVFSASFASLRFETTYNVPGYRAWLDQNGSGVAYAYHKQVLQYLQSRQGRARWVLKSPDHVFTAPDLLRAYPDARLIITHRDPFKVIPSVTRLTVVLRALFSSAVDPVAVGQTVAARWAEGAARLRDMRALSTASGPALHLHFRDIARAPLTTVACIYDHFGITLSQAAQAAMRRFLARHPNGDYARNTYSIGQPENLSADAVSSFQSYIETFRPRSEAEPAGALP